MSRDFVLLCLASFLFSEGTFVLFPVLPVFVVQELKGVESQVGLIMGVFAVAAVLTRPVSGRLVDVWTRKSGLRLGAVIYCIAPLLYTQVASVSAMLGVRFFHGIGIALYTTAAGVMVADLAPASRRGEAMGYYGMTINLAMAVGPALGAVLMQPIGFTGLFCFAALLAFFSLLLIHPLHEPTRAQSDLQTAGKRPPLFSRAALLPGFVALCMTITFGAVVSFLPLFVQRHQLGNPGLFFMVYSGVVVASRPLAGQWSDRFGRAAMIIPSMACLGLAMVTLAYTTSLSGLVGAAVLQGLGFGGVQPAIMALAVDRATVHERGPALATLMGAFDMGVGIGAVGLGFVLQQTNFTVMYLCAGAIAFLAAGVFAVATARQ